jgi:DNA phosphorothioation-dependent restriction protein DptH
MSMDSTKASLLADQIINALQSTAVGHCARVDFLTRDEARSVCQTIMSRSQPNGTVFHILTSDSHEATDDPLFLTTDQAVELRNRKQERLCLFVPADVVDAAVSSLGNSFELVDARVLQRRALDQFLAEAPESSLKAIRGVFAQLHGHANAGDDQRLDFSTAVLARMAEGGLTQAGLELWRVGLIADGSVEFSQALRRNRVAVLKLARPAKPQATPGERIQSLGVDTETAAALARFFRNRPLYDRHAWSRVLAEGAGPTFDTWRFPEQQPSNLQSVTLRPFVDTQGAVEKSCRLDQPDGPGGFLWARCGPKQTLVVRWTCDPPQPRNLARWRIEILPTSEVLVGTEVELPAREVPALRRTVTLSLDLELEEPLDSSFEVHVVPLDAAGNPIESEETREATLAVSEEFFLTPEMAPQQEAPIREHRQTVPTIPFGRLQAAVEERFGAIVESQPQWLTKDLDYFRLKLNERRVVHIGLSGTLLQLERRVLREPRSGGCFVLNADDLRPVAVTAIESHPLGDGRDGSSESWSGFWRAREGLFSRLTKAQPRDLIEVADWTSDLANGALRYAQTYRELIEDLLARNAQPPELEEALAIDTLLVRLTTARGDAEETAVVLPTHPLRMMWMANYSQLLRTWEERVLELDARRGRKESVDLRALERLGPTNVPAFAYHPLAQQPFALFQNLLFFHGVALPPSVPDPHRRYSDVATILGAESEQANVGDIQPARMAALLSNFRELHPYTESLAITLVNPDRGAFFAAALRKLLQRNTEQVDDIEPVDHRPLFQITSYVEDTLRGAGTALDQIRQLQLEEPPTVKTDLFLPALATTVRPIDELDETLPPDAHLAVVTDFTQPTIVPLPPADRGSGSGTTTGSFSLYGLITRLVPQFISEGDRLLWRYQVVTDGTGRPEPHPSGPRYSDTLVDLQAVLLAAGGRLLGGAPGAQPTIEVVLEPERRRLLERLHASTNWVLTLDRFFALDYYDSPNEPHLSESTRKYVLDYAPDFAEGLGHRLMATTAWRDEIGALLGRAMDELGFATIDQSASRLLHYLKTVSGHLALQAQVSETSAAAAVGLGVVTAWLQGRQRLDQAVLVPVDLHPRLFTKSGTGASARDERRCDLVLIGLKRNIVEAVFIEVKWRRGSAPLESLGQDMVLQMLGSAEAMRTRFFGQDRVDGALQRAYLANVLRFYFERSRRYGLFEPTAEAPFLEHLSRLEKTGLAFRPSYEGYIVSLNDQPRKPFTLNDAKITLLTAAEFESSTEFYSSQRLLDGQLNEASPDVGQNTSEASAMEAEKRDEVVPTPKTQGAKTVGEETVLNEQATRDSDPVEQADSLEDAHPVTQEPQAINIPLGEAEGRPVNWMPSTKGSPHLFIIGIPGQGKSWTVTRILAELSRQGVPALVLDFHGQFADPHSSFVQSARPVVLDAAEGLPFSPFECTTNRGAGDWKANSFVIAEIFGYVAGLGDMQRDIVYTAVRDAYLAHGYGEEPMPRGDYPTLKEVQQQIENKEQARRVANVSARCRALLEMDLFNPASDSPFLLSMIRGGLVIDLHNLYVETVQLAAGAFLLRKLYKDMFQWGETGHMRLAIVLDEAHRLARDVTLPKIMKEGRKFGIAVIVASQGLADFHQDMLSNAGTKVIFRTNYPESRRIAGFIRARSGQDLSSQIEQLRVGYAYIQTPEMRWGVITQMYPWDYPV